MIGTGARSEGGRETESCRTPISAQRAGGGAAGAGNGLKLAPREAGRIACARMRLLDRYLLRELLTPLAFCLCGFLIFWISFDLFSELQNFQEKKLHGIDVVEYYAVKAPEFLVTVAPMALLLALLYALTNHSRHHELVAIRAAGVSLWRMCAVYLAVGALASIVVFALNELWVPNTVDTAEQILNRRVEKPAGMNPRESLRNLGFRNAREGRTWQIGAYNLASRVMTDPKVNWQLANGYHRELFAKRALWTNGMWVFYDVYEDTYAGGGLTNRNVTNILAMPDFTESPAVIQREVKMSERLSHRGAKRADIPLAELIPYLRLHPNAQGRDEAWLLTMLHGRLAVPWTCLVVVLIAVPFGAPSGRRNVYAGVASSILICLAYFVLQQVGLALGAGGYVAPWLGGWAPNIATAAVGLWLSWRVR